MAKERTRPDVRWRYLDSVADSAGGKRTYQSPEAAVAALAQRNVTNHVVAASILVRDFFIGAGTLRGLQLEKRTVEQSASAHAIATTVGLAETQPTHRFTLCVDGLTEKPKLRHQLLATSKPRKGTPPVGIIDTRADGDSQHSFDWKVEDLELTHNADAVRHVLGRGVPTSVTVESPSPPAPAILAASRLPPSAQALWTLDGADVLNASPERVRFVVRPVRDRNGPAGTRWVVLDLDSIAGSPRMPLGTLAPAWQMWHQLIGGEYLDGLPSYGPATILKNEQLVAACLRDPWWQATDGREFSKTLLEAILVKGEIPEGSANAIYELQLDAVLDSIAIESSGPATLTKRQRDLIDGMARRKRAHHAAERELRQSSPLASGNLLFAVPPVGPYGPHRGRRTSTVSAPQDGTYRHSSSLDGPLAADQVCAGAEMDVDVSASDGAADDTGNTKMALDAATPRSSPSSPVASPGRSEQRSSASPDNGPSALPQRPARSEFAATGPRLRADVRTYDAIDNPVAGARRLIASYRAGLLDYDASVPIIAERKAGRRPRNRPRDEYAAAFGIKTKSELEVKQANGHNGGDGDEDELHPGDEDDGLGLAQAEQAAESSDGDEDLYSPEDVIRQHVQQTKNTQTAGDERKGHAAKPRKSTSSKGYQWDHGPMKKQLQLRAVQIPADKADRRLGFVASPGNGDEHSRLAKGEAVQLEGTHAQRRLQLPDGTTLEVLDRGLARIDEVHQLQHAFEGPFVAEIYRKSIEYAGTTSPNHGWISSAGIGLDFYQRPADGFRHAIGTIRALSRWYGMNEQALTSPDASGVQCCTDGGDGATSRRSDPRHAVWQRDSDGVREADRERLTARFEAEWRKLHRVEQETLASLNSPLFLYQIVRSTFAERRVLVGPAHTSTVESSWQQTHIAFTTAMSTQAPQQFDQLAASLACDPVAQSQGFVNFVTAPGGNGSVLQEPSATARSRLATATLLGPRAERLSRVLTPIFSAALLGAPLAGAPGTAWRDTLAELVGTALVGFDADLGTVLPQGGVSAAAEIAARYTDAISAVAAAIAEQYKACSMRLSTRPEAERPDGTMKTRSSSDAKKQPQWTANATEQRARLQDWLESVRGISGSLETLLEAQTMWRIWRGAGIPMTCNGTALVVPVAGQLDRVNAATGTLETVVRNAQSAIGLVNNACANLSPSERDHLARDMIAARSRANRTGLMSTLKRRGDAQALEDLPLLEGLHDLDCIEVDSTRPLEDGVMFPPVVTCTLYSKEIAEDVRIVNKHLGRESAGGGAEAQEVPGFWANGAPFLVPMLYRFPAPDTHLPHGQITYVPGARSILHMDPAVVKSSKAKPSKYADGKHTAYDVVSDGLTAPKRLAGWTDLPAARFWTAKQPLEIAFDDKNRITIQRLSPVIAKDDHGNLSWASATNNGRHSRSAGKIVQWSLENAPARFVGIPDWKRDRICNVLGEERGPSVPDPRQAVGSSPPRRIFHLGLDEGEVVYCAGVLASEADTDSAHAFLIESKSFKARDQETQAAAAKRAAETPISRLAVNIAEHAEQIARDLEWTVERIKNTQIDHVKRKRDLRRQNESVRRSMTDRLVSEIKTIVVGKRTDNDQQDRPVLIIHEGASGRRGDSKASGVNRTGSIGDALVQRLHREPELEVIHVKLNELRTSRTCPRIECAEALYKMNKNPIKTVHPLDIETGRKCKRILQCINCGRVYHRDISASACMIVVGIFQAVLGRHPYSDETERVLKLPPRNKKVTITYKVTKQQEEHSAAVTTWLDRFFQESTNNKRQAGTDAEVGAAAAKKARDSKKRSNVEPPGMANSGNDCFAIATIQALLYFPPLKLKNKTHVLKRKKNLSSEILKSFTACVTALTSTEAGTTAPGLGTLRADLAESAVLEGSDPTAQEDAAEFLEAIMVEAETAELRGSGLTTNEIGCPLVHRKVCRQCGTSETEADDSPLKLWTIRVQEGSTVEEAIRDCMAEKEGQSFCKGCRKNERMRRSTEIQERRFFVVQAEIDFQQDSTYTVSEDAVIKLSRGSSSIEYELACVVAHGRAGISGHTNSGHYIAYTTAASQLKRVFRLDDLSVTPDEWLRDSERPYLLFFQMRTSERTKEKKRQQTSPAEVGSGEGGGDVPLATSRPGRKSSRPKFLNDQDG